MSSKADLVYEDMNFISC